MTCGGHDNRPLTERIGDLNRFGELGFLIAAWMDRADDARRQGDRREERHALRAIALCFQAFDEALEQAGVVLERDPEWEFACSLMGLGPISCN